MRQGKSTTMPFSDHDIAKLADLAKVALSQEEREQLKLDLTQIVGYVKRIRQASLDKLSPMTNDARHMQLPLRNDDALESPPGRRCIEDSAGYKDGLVEVPAILPPQSRKED
ncbi:MAG: Asp-tRNA(Asn)/Glu-tRNA(Gln) amidotransferase subunit GatC [Myxococcota bacterium]